jgi:hypothetical protein
MIVITMIEVVPFLLTILIEIWVIYIYFKKMYSNLKNLSFIIPILLWPLTDIFSWTLVIIIRVGMIFNLKFSE